MRYREPLRIWIGWDDRETVAYHVLAHSIITRATGPVSISPLRQETLRTMGCYWRERGPTESTAFSLTRFLVPHLSGYVGHAVFLDCDMLIQTDICALWAEIESQCFWGRGWPGTGDQNKSLLCCHHDYEPTAGVKFLGNVQTVYPRKNFSSFMVFDNARCKALTPNYVNTATGLQLHRFQWLPDEQLGRLPLDWNHLVGEYAPNPDARGLHYTLGGPWLTGYRDVDHAGLWLAEQSAMLGVPVLADASGV